MTAALAAALAVAVVALVVLLVSAQRRHRDLAEQRRRGEDLASDLGAAREATSESSLRADNAEKAAAEAIAKTASAVESAAVAERRASEAEEQARRYEQALAAHREDGSPDSLHRPMWELERVRVEREWADLAGPGAVLPVDWQPTVGAVVAIELEMIKEVIGTPASLEIDSSDRDTSGSASALAARLGVELVRKLARSGEEMTVAVGATELTVAHPESDDHPDLKRLVDAAAWGGGELRQAVAEGTFVVRLRYP